MRGGWRPEDEALLVRLEDERLFEAVWAALTPEGTPAPHPRAAGVLVELRGHEDGRAAIEHARLGTFAPILHALSHPDPVALTPPLAHHLALLWDRVGRACSGSTDPVLRSSAAKARLRAVAMWLWLGEEATYLATLASQVIGDALSERDVTAAARDVAFEPLLTLGEEAREGAQALTPKSEIALGVLGRVAEACRMAGCSEAFTATACGRARRERDAAVESAIARIERSLEEATTRGASPDELGPLLWDAVAVWRWADHDVHVERSLVRVITPRLWDHYREKQWDVIRTLLRPLEGPIESLARRVEDDPTQLAYAAPCAQMLVFQAEVSQTFDVQMTIVERALRICPTHRNARVVCADLLVERAMRRLETAMPWGSGDALADAERDCRRAMDLYPQLKRLEDAKRRLLAQGIDLDAG
ncbi:MAG: hypothetical protein H6719_05350 [Sandaracinaceae bacterium]|nr:hypothetical protein [Sandaracinaceae bacterium]